MRKDADVEVNQMWELSNEVFCLFGFFGGRLGFFAVVVFWLHLWHVEIPRPGTEPPPHSDLRCCSDYDRSLTHREFL